MKVEQLRDVIEIKAGQKRQNASKAAAVLEELATILEPFDDNTVSQLVKRASVQNTT